MLLGELMVRLGLNYSQYKTGIKDAKSDATDLSKHVTSAFKVIGAAAVAGFGAAVTGSVMGASGLENYRNTLNVVMKDQKKAAETMAWAVKYANDTPFETDEVVDATVKLQSYGMTAKEVLPQIGDMAGVMNKSLNQAVEAIADAQTGELERLKEFGITKQMIIDKGNKIMRGKEIVNNKGQITDQKAFNKALFALMEERYKGGTALQATSFKGLMSTLSGTFKMTLAQMAGISETGEVQAGGFFDKLKHGVQSLNDQLDKWSKDGTLTTWANGISGAFSIAFDVVMEVGGAVKDLVKWMTQNIPISKQQVKEAWDGMREAGQQLKTFIMTEFLPKVQEFAKNFKKSFEDYLGPDGASKILENLKGLLQDLKTTFADVWEEVKKFTPDAGSAVGWFFGVIADNVNTCIDALRIFLELLHDAKKVWDDWNSGSKDVMRPGGWTSPAHSVGRNANGTDYWRGGSTVVGERGPEVVNLPRGSQVVPNSKLSGNTYNVTVYGGSAKIDEKYLAKTFRRMEVGWIG